MVTVLAPSDSLFQPVDDGRSRADALLLTPQPREGVTLCFQAKPTCRGTTVPTQRLRFRYAEAFGPLTDGCETLPSDVLMRDQPPFVRADEVEAARHQFAPLLEETVRVHSYEAGRGDRERRVTSPLQRE